MGPVGRRRGDDNWPKLSWFIFFSSSPFLRFGFISAFDSSRHPLCPYKKSNPSDFFFFIFLNLAQLNFCYLQQKGLSLSAHKRVIWHCPPKVLNEPWILRTTQFSAWISTLFPLTLLCCYNPTAGGQDLALIEDAMPPVCLYLRTEQDWA